MVSSVSLSTERHVPSMLTAVQADGQKTRLAKVVKQLVGRTELGLFPCCEPARDYPQRLVSDIRSSSKVIFVYENYSKELLVLSMSKGRDERSGPGRLRSDQN
jgi:hypothetical protein